jgi:hypothetical protein
MLWLGSSRLLIVASSPSRVARLAGPARRVAAGLGRRYHPDRTGFLVAGILAAP